MTKPFGELKIRPYRRWYRFGLRSPIVLYKRTIGNWMPLRRLRWFWQRGYRGYSDDQLWSLNYALARLTVIGVSEMREWGHSYPSEFSDPPIGDGGGWEKWDDILARIEGGFQAWLDEDGWFTNKPEQEAKFNDAMELYAHWFGALWD